MGRIVHIILITLGFLLAGCSKIKEECTEAGEQTMLSLRVDSFNKIMVENRIDIFLVQDSTKVGLVELNGPSNLLDGISFKISAGQLEVSNSNRCKWLRELDKRVKCTIYVDDLEQIETRHDATFNSLDTLRFDKLLIEQRSTGTSKLLLDVGTITLNHRESGLIQLFGKVSVFIPTLYETGRADCKELHSELIFAYHYGLGRLEVFPLLELHTTTENEGDTYYYNEPPYGIYKKGSGTGRVLAGY